MKSAGGLGLDVAVEGSGQVWQLTNQIASWFSGAEDCHGWRSCGGALPHSVPALALALEGGTEIIGSRQVRREIQALRFCFPCYVTLLTQSKAAPN